MRKVDSTCIYDKSGNYWLRKESAGFTFGISDWGQYLLGNISSVSEFPIIDQDLKKDELLILLESNKASNEILIPFDVSIIAFNTRLLKQPELINIDCYGEGWLVKIAIVPTNAMTAWDRPEAYKKAIDSLFRKG